MRVVSSWIPNTQRSASSINPSLLNRTISAILVYGYMNSFRAHNEINIVSDSTVFVTWIERSAPECASEVAACGATDVAAGVIDCMTIDAVVSVVDSDVDVTADGPVDVAAGVVPSIWLVCGDPVAAGIATGSLAGKTSSQLFKGTDLAPEGCCRRSTVCRLPEMLCASTDTNNMIAMNLEFGGAIDPRE